MGVRYDDTGNGVDRRRTVHGYFRMDSLPKYTFFEYRKKEAVQFYRSLWDMGIDFHISWLLCGKASQDDKAAGPLGRFLKTDRRGNLLCPGGPDAAACHGKGID